MERRHRKGVRRCRKRRPAVDVENSLCLASSSARGGLRMIAIGLVPELTAEAGRQAALGAGAKIVKVYSHELTRSDVAEISALRPDLLLLAGGTDGGNRNVIEHNARALAGSPLDAPVIVAGNRNARDAVVDLLQAGGKRCYPTENVLPELDQLNVEPVRAVIRDAFVRHIVEAKGLDRAVLKEIESWRGLPIAQRYFTHLPQEAVEDTLSRLARQGALMRYPPLVEEEGVMVAQSEHSLYLGPGGVEILTVQG